MPTPDAVGGSFLLDLHRASRRMRHAEFRPWVYDALQSCIQSDSGFWMRGAIEGHPFHAEARLSLHEYYLYRQPDALMSEYIGAQMWRDDAMAAGVVAGPGRAYRQCATAAVWPPRWNDFQRRYGQQHLMSIILMDVDPRLFVVFSLYRSDAARPFTENDARVFELLTPHMDEAWRENWLADRALPAMRSSEFRLTVVAEDGVLTLAQDGVAELIQLEWPAWHGPYLPDVLQCAYQDPTVSWWYGERIAAHRQGMPDRKTLVRVRPAHAFDRLPARQREAAEHFACGVSQGDVALRMGLSGSTVNNYLVEVYRSLGLTDKAELALLVERLQR